MAFGSPDTPIARARERRIPAVAASVAAFEWAFGVQPTGLTGLFIGPVHRPCSSGLFIVMAPWSNPGSRARIADPRLALRAFLVRLADAENPPPDRLATAFDAASRGDGRLRL